MFAKTGMCGPHTRSSFDDALERSEKECNAGTGPGARNHTCIAIVVCCAEHSNTV